LQVDIYKKIAIASKFLKFILYTFLSVCGGLTDLNDRFVKK